MFAQCLGYVGLFTGNFGKWLGTEGSKTRWGICLHRLVINVSWEEGQGRS